MKKILQAPPKKGVAEFFQECHYLIVTLQTKQLFLNLVMITRERLKGAYSEGEALAIYNEVKANGDFIGFAHEYILSP